MQTSKNTYVNTNNEASCDLGNLKEQVFSAIMELTHEEQEELLKKVRELRCLRQKSS